MGPLGSPPGSATWELCGNGRFGYCLRSVPHPGIQSHTHVFGMGGVHTPLHTSWVLGFAIEMLADVT